MPLTIKDLPFVWVQCDMGNEKYYLVDGQTGEIIKEDMTGAECDYLFRKLDETNIVYVRQFN